MTVLQDTLIRHMGEDLVRPFDPEAVQPASIDLRLGTTFLVPDPHDLRYIDLGNMPDMSKYMRRVERTAEEGFTIHPGDFILGSTAEWITIPVNIVGRLEGKSSLGRIGLIIHVTAGFFDPGFEGVGTLEFYNVWKTPIVLRPGEFICQMSFTYTMGACAKPYNGRYKGDEGVAPSRLGIGQMRPPVQPIASRDVPARSTQPHAVGSEATWKEY